MFQEQMLNEAKSRGIRSKYIVHDFRTKLPFPSTSFDAVYCESALEHVPKRKPSSFLQEFYPVLVPRGILYIGAKKGRRRNILSVRCWQ